MISSSIDFLLDYESTLTFGLIYGLFALATYSSLASGVLSVAAATFGAIGGFLYAGLQTHLSFGVLLGLVAGTLAGAAAAFLLSLLVLRLASHYVAMATIALVLVTRVCVVNLPELTGGVNGTSVERTSSLWWVLGVSSLWSFVFWRLRRSRYGLAAATVREDPQAASTLGVEVRRVQRTGFVMSGAVGGCAGVLMADQLRFIGPDTFHVDLAFTMLAAVVLGGAYHWLGAFVGALVFRFLPDVLSDYVDDWYEVASGVTLVAVMIYLPHGFVDPRRRARVSISRRLGWKLPLEFSGSEDER